MPVIKMVVMMNTSRFIKLLLLLTSPLPGFARALQASTPCAGLGHGPALMPVLPATKRKRNYTL